MTARKWELFDHCQRLKWREEEDEFKGMIDSFLEFPDCSRAICEGMNGWVERVEIKYFAHIAEIRRTPDGDEIAARLGHELEDE